MGQYARLIGYLVLAIVSWSSSVQAGETKTAEERRAALERGEIVMDLAQHPVTKVYLPTGQCLVEATVDEVWYIITDFDSFQEYLPHVVYYRPVCWK